MAENKNIEVGGRLHSIATGNVLAGANEILDDAKGKKQSVINAENDIQLASHESRLNAYTEGKFVTVSNFSALPATGAVDTVYRVSSWDGTANNGQGAVDVTKYSEYAWQNGAYKFLDVKTQIGEVFDISEYNSGAVYTDLANALGNNGINVPSFIRRGGMSVKFKQVITPATYTVVKTEGATEQPTGTEIQSDPGIISGTYTAGELSVFSTLPATLNSSLTYYLAVTETVDEQEVTTYTTWVITYVHTNDNKYIQARLMANAFTTDVTQWQGVDDEPTAVSSNLVKSDGIFNSSALKSIHIDEAGWLNINFLKGKKVLLKTKGDLSSNNFHIYINSTSFFRFYINNYFALFDFTEETGTLRIYVPSDFGYNASIQYIVNEEYINYILQNSKTLILQPLDDANIGELAITDDYEKIVVKQSNPAEVFPNKTSVFSNYVSISENDTFKINGYNYCWNGSKFVKTVTDDTLNNYVNTREGIYDVSYNNPTGGVNGGDTYSLAEAIAAIPSNRKYPGMYIRFKDSNSGNYVHYKLTYNRFTTNTTWWQGDTNVVERNNKNNISSDAVATLCNIIYTENIESTTASWKFNNQLHGHKYAARIVLDNPNAKITAAIIYTGSSSTGQKLSSDWSIVDLSTISISRVYFSVDTASNATLYAISSDSAIYDFIYTKISEITEDVFRNTSTVNKIVTASEYPWRNFGSMNHITVKKDGSADFTEIQEAINSIEDASANNQYEIQVYDDYVITDLKDLYVVSNPKIKNTSDSPSSGVALVITKDYVHIRGCGGKRLLSIENPNIDMPGGSFKRIQTIYPKGNCIIDNFEVSIRGGRYAIHQESDGVTNHPDHNATTIFRNLTVIHYGNSEYTNGSSWTSTIAHATGTTGGLCNIYENVEWIAFDYTEPYYFHSAT